jgi:hypothetical protein
MRLGKSRLRWEDNIRIDLKEKPYMVRTGFIWLRIGTNAVLVNKVIEYDLGFSRR